MTPPQERKRPTIKRADEVRLELLEVLRTNNWNIAMHGSYIRDLDFIAVPWSSGHPTNVPTLVGIIEATFSRKAIGPTWKPHGRLGYGFVPREYTGTRPRTWDISFIDPTNAIERGFHKDYRGKK
jgi:hypothetical protein